MDIIDRTIQREGGFVNHPSDPGGATNMGITRGTLSRFLGREASVDDVRELSHDGAREIYQKFYMTLPRFDEIEHEWLREICFDAGVLFGPGRAARWLQQAADVGVDGVIGPVTLGKVNAMDARRLGLEVIAHWLRRHGDRVQRGASSPAFIGGWVRRASAHLLAVPL